VVDDDVVVVVMVLALLVVALLVVALVIPGHSTVLMSDSHDWEQPHQRRTLHRGMWWSFDSFHPWDVDNNSFDRKL
jgi:hypothetical protein